jgi:hypothetical protein
MATNSEYNEAFTREMKKSEKKMRNLGQTIAMGGRSDDKFTKT